MALEDILAAMEAEAATERRRIAAEAEARAAQIAAAAADDAQVIRERHCRESRAPLRDEAARRLNRARLAATRARHRAREELFLAAVARAEQCLGDARRQGGYADLLCALAAEALTQLDGDAVLRADARDAAILRAAFPAVRTEFDLVTWGGVEARAANGSVAVVNTLEARLAQAQPFLRRAVMPLFEPAEPGAEPPRAPAPREADAPVPEGVR